MEEAGDLEAIVLRILGDAPARRRKRHELEERSGEITKRLAALSRRCAAHKGGDVLKLVCRSRPGPRVVYLNALTRVVVLRSRSGPVCVYLPGAHSPRRPRADASLWREVHHECLRSGSFGTGCFDSLGISIRSNDSSARATAVIRFSISRRRRYHLDARSSPDVHHAELWRGEHDSHPGPITELLQHESGW